jgi:2-polyprenyl-6-methoxyphenol hydroxylase-like FAD-dependent oxidoreductase
MNDVRRVLVVGGGVGGLTAATAMAQRGMDVVLIDRVPAFDVPGVGLGQPANALRVYRDLGVLDDVLDGGFIYDSMHIFDQDRNLIAGHRFLLGDDETPAVCALSRARLHDILRGAAQKAGVEIRLGLTVTSMDETPDSVTVTFSDTRSEAFDVVAGFDGIRSSTREYLYGTAFLPRPSGFGAWRVQVPRPEYVQGMEFLQGIGSKTGAMPLADDVMYVFHIRPEDPDAWFEKSDFVNLLRERMAPYGSYAGEVRDALDESSDIVYSPLEPLLIPWPWHRGRVVIGGDAAHTFPPHLTQGAAMAAEDALVLADELGQNDKSLEHKLSSYAQRRYARCAFVYTFSKQWLEDEQAVNSPARMEVARAEQARNASTRIAVSDRILNQPVVRPASREVFAR